MSHTYILSDTTLSCLLLLLLLLLLGLAQPTPSMCTLLLLEPAAGSPAVC